ncbi:MAG: LytTR family DNA-binding domain-containing protein [Eubacterium sp.]|nr:LytTR family DNA-binding domain-containing protein [Eubacterium sp.]
MRIAVCDDEKEIREILAEKVMQIYPDAVLLCYSSGEELLLEDSQPDILLLDIQMAGKNGMETAREFRKTHKDTILVFVTALEEYVYQAFDVEAFHYLVKPFDDQRFEEILKNAVNKYEVRKRRGADSLDQAGKSLMIMTGGKHVTVNMEEIVYAEVYDRKIILHTIHEDIEYYGKMKDLQKQAGADFYRPHRAYLVNFNYIRKYDAATIDLERGQALMAKKNYHEFVQCYLRYNQRKRRNDEP